MPTFTALPYSLLKIIEINGGHSTNMDSLSKFQILSFMKTTTNSAFPIFPRVTTVFLLELTEATFGHIVNIVHARKQKYADLLSKPGRHL